MSFYFVQICCLVKNTCKKLAYLSFFSCKISGFSMNLETSQSRFRKHALNLFVKHCQWLFLFYLNYFLSYKIIQCNVRIKLLSKTTLFSIRFISYYWNQKLWGGVFGIHGSKIYKIIFNKYIGSRNSKIHSILMRNKICCARRCSGFLVWQKHNLTLA